MMSNDDSGFTGERLLPRESPLPRNHSSERDSEIYYVITTPGTYFLELSAFDDESAGKYDLDLVVARPGLEAAPLGTRQILFIDFDGSTVDLGKFQHDGVSPLGKETVSPLVESLPGWGLTAADENAVIDTIMAKVTDKLSTYIGAHGLNANFGVDIRNSRDNPDPGKNPFVSRVSVGLVHNPEFFAHVSGANQDIDVGNFKTDDDAVVTTEIVNGAIGVIPIQPPATLVSFVSEPIANVVTHEIGHNLGCFHSDISLADIFAGVPNIMDQDNGVPLGPDFIWGSADDINLQFGADGYSSIEGGFHGIDDTLNTVAFGLSTGKGTVTQVQSTFAASIISTTMHRAARELLETPDAALV